MSARTLTGDDLEANRRLLEAKLTADYYDVLMAQRGEEAVQLAKREKPDLILLDVMMPGGIDGYEACRRLKAMPETRHIPVVILTTLDDRDNKVRGLQAGAEEFLPEGGHGRITRPRSQWPPPRRDRRGSAPRPARALAPQRRQCARGR